MQERWNVLPYKLREIVSEHGERNIMWGRASKQPERSLEPVELWNRNGWPQQDVVGESYHEAVIRKLFPPVMSGGQELNLPAHLIPDPKNPHDPHAVAVHIQGQLVGYLPKEVAPAYQPMLLELEARGQVAVTSARLWAYESADWENPRRKNFNAQIQVVLDDPWMCLPINSAPTNAWALLPHGSALQARKEEEHMDALSPFLTPHGEAWAIATLDRKAPPAEGKAPKPVVEIKLNDHVVGELTPAMSEHFLPVIDSLSGQGCLTAARVIVKGNQLKTDVVLHATKAHELPPSWLEQHVMAGQPAQAAGAPRQDGVAPTRAVEDPSSVSDHADAAPLLKIEPSGVEHDLRHPATRQYRFCPAPGWPSPPPGWLPQPGWQPSPEWPLPPLGWRFWEATD